MLRKVDFFIFRITTCRLRGRKNLLDDAVAHRDGMMLKDCARRVDRYDPAGVEEELLGYLGVPLTSTTTRRFGVRHSISDLRSFVSGQPFTGLVLPEPRVSILDWSKPLETR